MDIKCVRIKFWKGLLNHAKKKSKLHENRSPTNSHFIGGASGFPGINLDYVILNNEAKVILFISPGDKNKNRKIFRSFFKHKNEIERKIGKPLDWKDKEKNRSCCIAHTICNGGIQSEESEWPEIHTAMVDAMIKLEKAFRPHIDKLPERLKRYAKQ